MQVSSLYVTSITGYGMFNRKFRPPLLFELIMCLEIILQIHSGPKMWLIRREVVQLLLEFSVNEKKPKNYETLPLTRSLTQANEYVDNKPICVVSSICVLVYFTFVYSSTVASPGSEVRVGTEGLGDGSPQRGPEAEPRWWFGEKPTEARYIHLQLSNAFLRRFAAESVLHVLVPPPPKKNFGSVPIPWPNTAGAGWARAHP